MQRPFQSQFRVCARNIQYHGILSVIIKGSPACPANVWMSRRLVRTSGGVSPPLNRPWTQGVRSTVGATSHGTTVVRDRRTDAGEPGGWSRPADANPCAGMSRAGGSSTRYRKERR